MAQMFRIVVIVVICLLVLSCWLDKFQPAREDTMVYKLKYVRLRPIHEADRVRIQSRMTAQEYNSMKAALQQALASEK